MNRPYQFKSRRQLLRPDLAAFTVLLAALVLPPKDVEAASRISLTSSVRKCDGAMRETCVVDGDTLWLNGEKIRIADIDAPEITSPKCSSELALGDRATDRLTALINAGPFELHAWPGRDKDRYGRSLRVLVRNGKSLGDFLVSEGLARTWSGRRQPWCGQ